MWEDEFVNHKDEYLNSLTNCDYDIALPFGGYEKVTWLNGFFATPKAFLSIPEITPAAERHTFEKLFKGSSVSIFSRIYSDIQNPGNGFKDTRPKMHNYYIEKYK